MQQDRPVALPVYTIMLHTQEALEVQAPPPALGVEAAVEVVLPQKEATDIMVGQEPRLLPFHLPLEEVEVVVYIVQDLLLQAPLGLKEAGPTRLTVSPAHMAAKAAEVEEADQCFPGFPHIVEMTGYHLVEVPNIV